MKKLAALCLPFASLVATALVPVPVAAQAVERYVEVFGDDKCPVSGDGEIVICARKPERERYRIPKMLRGEGSVANQSWASRATALEFAGASGVGSCSASGEGGWTGCWKQLMQQARQESKTPAVNTTAPSAK